MKCVSVYLEDEKIEKLDELASKEKRSRANFLYLIIEKYLEENK